MRRLTIAGTVAVAMVALPVVTFAATRRDTSTTVQQAQTANLFKALRSESAKAAYCVDELTRFNRAHYVSRETEANALNDLRDDVNAMGRIVARFEAETEDATPVEREAFARAIPLLSDMAATTQAAITALNENPEMYTFPTFQAYIGKLSADSSELSKETAKFVSLESTQTKEERLRAVLDVGAE